MSLESPKTKYSEAILPFLNSLVAFVMDIIEVKRHKSSVVPPVSDTALKAEELMGGGN